MVNLDDIRRENNKEHIEKWPYIPYHPYRILTIGGSGSGKTNTLLNLIKEQDDIDKIYLYAKNLSKPKYQFLIKNREDAGMRHLMIQMHLLSVQRQWMMFMVTLMITTQTEKNFNCFWWYDCRHYE